MLLPASEDFCAWQQQCIRPGGIMSAGGNSKPLLLLRADGFPGVGPPQAGLCGELCEGGPGESLHCG